MSLVQGSSEPKNTQARGAAESIYQRAVLYDRVVQPGPCEDYYRDLARQVDGSILELGCGTGRLTVPLARDGQDVTALDLAPEMLDLARRKAGRERLNVAFMEGDMSDFDLGRRHDLIIVACNSLAHLLTNDRLVSCFRCVRAHLSRDGIFAFDIVNPDIRLLARQSAQRVRLDQGPNPSSAVPIEEVSSYSAASQVRTASWHVLDDAGRSRTELTPLSLRQIFPQELPALLACGGLRLERRFGDFARNAFEDRSLNQICVARAA